MMDECDAIFMDQPYHGYKVGTGSKTKIIQRSKLLNDYEGIVAVTGTAGLGVDTMMSIDKIKFTTIRVEPHK